MPEHPLRRRYGLELGLGLALAALAAWLALGAEPEVERRVAEPDSPRETPEDAASR